MFTKDVVYVRGLLRVHAFLVAALKERRLELIPRLFAGRLTLQDALELDFLKAPKQLPGWASDVQALSAYLAWAGFNAGLPLVDLTLDSFR